MNVWALHYHRCPSCGGFVPCQFLERRRCEDFQLSLIVDCRDRAPSRTDRFEERHYEYYSTYPSPSGLVPGDTPWRHDGSMLFTGSQTRTRALIPYESDRTPAVFSQEDQ